MASDMMQPQDSRQASETGVVYDSGIEGTGKMSSCSRELKKLVQSAMELFTSGGLYSWLRSEALAEAKA